MTAEFGTSDAQREVVAFLRDPASYPAQADPVAVVETHASLVFLAGARAYKLKRAVRYAYLDFSTLERRHAACTAELKLNRRTAPQLYLEVRAVSRLPDGSLAWGRQEGGETVDFVVVMRRFGDADLLDMVARAGGLTAPLLRDVAAHIAQFHAKAEIRPQSGGAAVISELAS